jgi:8-oxo-dGTP diphosphatase
MTFPTHIVAAAGIVEDNNGNLLMVNTYHGGWVFPGGQVETGENITDAVIREVKEESGIDISVEKLFVISSNTTEPYEGYNGVGKINTKVILDFICTFVGGALRSSDENSESCWIPKNKVLDMITAPAVKARFQAYLDFDGSVRYLEYITRPEFQMKLSRFI